MVARCAECSSEPIPSGEKPLGPPALAPRTCSRRHDVIIFCSTLHGRFRFWPSSVIPLESTPKTSPIYLFGVGVAVPSYPIHVDTLYTIFTFRVAMAHGIIFVRLCGLGGIGGHHRPGSERQTSPGTATKPLQHDFFFLAAAAGGWW